ncbi:ribbon-helix-helix protein, CopG family [Herbiconiux daphne]|uniref:Ribbon-helix-helix protein, CopG family n=1 Tax=Herbiconiux daphne TaxID=2970914 RepID=A0ABT2GY38_9MICO|nr:ribbon-helix-helix protein, CopG family [Herbiconiux daphne]MCS5732876.1 ribbon-helix-helix protein, CopG family [Herbiconiux daphne]
MAGDEIDYEALAARLTDTDVHTGAHKELYGEDAAAHGRAFLLREYGSEDALKAAMRPGRPKLGTRKPGPSPTVRARVSEEDFAAFTRLREETGRSEAELLREAVHLLLAQHKLAS